MGCVHCEPDASEELDTRSRFAVKLMRPKLQGHSLHSWPLPRLGGDLEICSHICKIHVCKEGAYLHYKGFSLKMKREFAPAVVV